MLPSVKAKELSLIKNIEKEIIKAVDEGRFNTVLTELTKEQIEILEKYGYTIWEDTEWGDNYYYISWQ